MKYIVYASSATKLINHDELLDILFKSRLNNERRHLTGMLLYGEGTFIQVLEGEEDVLKEIYQVIEADPRHKNLIKMAECDISERNFPEWLMGFKSASAQDLGDFDGYINPEDEVFMGEQNDNALIALLKKFAAVNV